VKKRGLLGRLNSPSLLQEAWEGFLRQEEGKAARLIKLGKIIKNIPILREETLKELKEMARVSQDYKEKVAEILKKILNNEKRYDKPFLWSVNISLMLLKESPPPEIIKVG